MQSIPKTVGIPWLVNHTGHLKHPFSHPTMNFRQPLIANYEEEADAYGNIAVLIIDNAADQSLQSEAS